MRNLKVSTLRYINGLKRPTRRDNEELMKLRGESLHSMKIREVNASDIAELAALHVKTWADTYPNARRLPTFEIREHQWKEQFKVNDGSWFCFVVENSQKKLIGFAKGMINKEGNAELNKIYLLREYQRLGLGRMMVCHVAKRFITMNQSTMSVFAEGTNPSCNFYEKLGAVHMRNPGGKINYGGYVWEDLRKLVLNCSDA